MARARKDDTEQYEAAVALLRRRPEFRLLSAGKLHKLLRREGTPLTLKRVGELLAN